MASHKPSPSVLAARIVAERKLRKEQQRSDQVALRAAREVIEQRLDGLDAERMRSVQDRAQYLTRAEYDIAHAALVVKVDELRTSMTVDIRALREARERDLGRQSGSQGVTSWLAPSLPAIIALLIGLGALYLALTR